MNPNSAQQDQDIIRILKEMESHKTSYPSDLLEARRAAFVVQVEQRQNTAHEVELSLQDHRLIQLLERLKAVETRYPAHLLNARRHTFKQHVVQLHKPGFWRSLRFAFQSKLPKRMGTSPASQMNLVVTSLIAVSFAAFAGFFIYGNMDRSRGFLPAPKGFVQSETVLMTTTAEVRIMCKEGYRPPLCLIREFNKSRDLTFQGNGSARPAVAKDTIPGYEDIHRAAFINDGLYGPGTSWISNSPNSWIKLDLGKPTTINTIAFGRDRLGQLNDRDPGRFVVSVALNDDVYADGNSSNDNVEYVNVFDSDKAGFDGTVSGAETVTVRIDPLAVRFIKITFENPGTAVDEVEVYLIEPPLSEGSPTRKPKDPTVLSTSTPFVVSSPLPLPTDTPFIQPTDTPMTMETPTPYPTDTPLPTDTPVPIFTDTPFPTETPVPLPLLTEPPLITDTPEPAPAGEKNTLPEIEP